MVKLWHSLNKWEIWQRLNEGETMVQPEQWLSYGTALKNGRYGRDWTKVELWHNLNNG